MNNLAEYLLKSGMVLAVLYSFYWLFLRRDTFFATNRIILILSVIVSLIIPLISFGWLQTETVVPTFTINFDAVPTTPDISAASNIQSVNAGWSFWNWLLLIYIIGAGIVLIRLLYQAIYLHAVERSSQTVTQGDIRVILLEKATVPFSYFNKIFIPRSEYNETAVDNIIEHEKSHLRQYHYIDILLIQILTIIHWFNPFAWLIEKSVKEIHEFLADKTVLQNGFDQGRYQALLVNQALGGPVFTLTNQFNQSLIKKRIVMMKRIKSPQWARLKALLLIPLVAALTLAFSNPKSVELLPAFNQDAVAQITVTGKVTRKENNRVLPGVNIVVKGTTTGTITTADGTFTISTDGNATLVFSYVGYKTEVIPVNGKTTMDVQLETSAITLDFDKTNSFVAQERKPAEASANTYVAVEETPAYPGGTEALKKFIYSNLKYPEVAIKNKMEGKVIVNYQVDANGNVVNAKVIRGVSPTLDAEALRVTNLIKGWQPGKQQGKPVVCSMVMPIYFKIVH